MTTSAASYYKLAGEHARSLYANTEALAHFQTALALGYPEPAVFTKLSATCTPCPAAMARPAATMKRRRRWRHG